MRFICKKNTKDTVSDIDAFDDDDDDEDDEDDYDYEEDEEESIVLEKTIQDLLDEKYLFYNWNTQTFENAFSCDKHIYRAYRKNWRIICEVYDKHQAFIATVTQTNKLRLIEGVHYINRYGYIVYKGAPLKESYIL